MKKSKTSKKRAGRKARLSSDPRLLVNIFDGNKERKIRVTDKSKIGWTDSSFNAWIGCTKVSEGCAGCYAAEMMDDRYQYVKWGPEVAGGTRWAMAESTWKKPPTWNRAAAKLGKPWLVFCPPDSDVFEDWTGSFVDYLKRPLPESVTTDSLRQRLFGMIDATPHLTWLVLTKRPQNIRQMWVGGPRSNVWLGTSTENQQRADERVPVLLECRDLASKLFLSCEPLLGPVDLRGWLDEGISWVITGGESGVGRRPCEIAWFQDLHDQCQELGAAFFMKQDTALNEGQQGRIPDSLWRIKEYPQHAKR